MEALYVSSFLKKYFSNEETIFCKSYKWFYLLQYSQNAQKFDIWDFKKAVLNTLLQAVKAISGSVIALKGQLVKGGGFLISTKGKLLSSAGEVITNLGRNIASSALVTAPKSQQTYPYPPGKKSKLRQNLYLVS